MMGSIQDMCLANTAELPIVRGKRILLVDDQDPVRDAITLLLSLDQHVVVQADNGFDALALYTPSGFDLVITDYEMPRMKGDELAFRVKENCPSQPIIMVTAYAERLVDRGAPVDALLDKPFQLRDLRQLISRLISERDRTLSHNGQALRPPAFLGAQNDQQPFNR